MRIGRKGLSDIVTNVLIILLVLVAIGIIWYFVRPFIANSVSTINSAQYTLALNIVPGSIRVNATTKMVWLNVHRGAGKGNLSALQIILEDTAGMQQGYRHNVTILELETKNFTINYTGSTLGTFKAVSVAPIIRLPDGREVMGKVSDRQVINAVSSSSTSSTGSGGGANPLSVMIITPNNGASYSYSYEPHPILLQFSITNGPASSCSYSFNNGVSNTSITSCQSSSFIGIGSGSWALRVFANGPSSTASASASLNVGICMGDTDGSGSIKDNDVTAIIDKVASEPGARCDFYSGGCPEDVNGDQFVDSLDLTDLYQSMRGENQQPSGGCSNVCYLDCDSSGNVRDADKDCFTSHDTRVHPLEYYDIDGNGVMDSRDDDAFNAFRDEFDSGRWPGCS